MKVEFVTPCIIAAMRRSKSVPSRRIVLPHRPLPVRASTNDHFNWYCEQIAQADICMIAGPCRCAPCEPHRHLKTCNICCTYRVDIEPTSSGRGILLLCPGQTCQFICCQCGSIDQDNYFRNIQSTNIWCFECAPDNAIDNVKCAVQDMVSAVLDKYVRV